MARSTAYEPVFSSKAFATLIELPRSKQRKVVNLLSRLSEFPNQPGDYSLRDEQGRDLQYLRLGSWRVSFWVDHAVRELRLVEITKL